MRALLLLLLGGSILLAPGLAASAQAVLPSGWSVRVSGTFTAATPYLRVGGAFVPLGDAPAWGDPPFSEDLALWLEGETLTESGGAVTGWLDQGAGDHDLDTVGGNPTVTTSPTGEPAVACDGTGDYLMRTATLTGFPSGATDRSMYVVAEYDGLGYATFAWGTSASGPGCGGHSFGLGVAGDGDLFVHRFCNDFETDTDGTGQGWLVHSVDVDGTDLRHYADGVEIATGDASGAQALSTLTQRFTACAEIDGSPNLDADVSAILVYDRSLTTGEREAVHEYLMGRYLGTSAPGLIPEWERAAVTGETEVSALSAGDLDGDGDGDWVYAQSLQGTTVEGFRWCRDLGGTSFECFAVNDTWYLPTSTSGALDFAGALEVVDVDGDGDNDVVISLDGHTGHGTVQVWWAENPLIGGSGDVTDEWAIRDLATYDDGDSDHMNDMVAADFDQDGEMDWAGRHLDRTGTFDTNNSVRIEYQDDLSTDTWVGKQVLVDPSEGLGVGDLDGDTYPDLILNGFWLENPDGSRTESWTRHDFAAWAYSQPVNPFDNSTKEAVVDLDGDGDLDVVLARAEGADATGESYEGKLAIYVNDGTPLDGGWTEIELESNWTNQHGLHVGDVDQDGQLDVVGGLMGPNDTANDEVWVWYLNADLTERERVEVTGQDYGYHVFALDTDGDTDLDLVAVDGYRGQLYHFRNERW